MARFGLSRCDGVSRRDLLQVGVMGPLGLGVADLLRLRAEAAEAPRRAGKAEACILVWLDGGPTHLDTFDPKPEAPAEIRGEFGAIETSVSGLRICEHLPRTAKVMHRATLIRSLTHELGNHDTGSHYLLTGHRPTPAMEFPSIGSVVAREVGFERALPPYVAVPDRVQYAGAGYLPQAYGPFSVGGDPSRVDYRVRDLSLPQGVRFDRVSRRQEFVRALDGFARKVEEEPATRSRDAFFEQAYRLITSAEARAAFDLQGEPEAVRQAYGRNRLGTSCLLARRLVQAGSRFVTVVDTGWDTHQQLGKALPDALFPGSGKLPALDRAYSALIGDLHDRGMLDSTLVVLMGEFGRTPKLNSQGGRDHWPRAGFACLAGGGVAAGRVIGATDAHGESPKEQPVRPEDLAVTWLSLLGVDPRKEYQTPDGRPMRLVDGGSVIAGVR